MAAEIDKYKKQTKKEVSENNYKLEITTASLIEYFAKKADKNLLSRNSLKEKGINFYGLVDHYKKTNSKKESVAL